MDISKNIFKTLQRFLPSIYPCIRLISGGIDSGGKIGRFLPHVHGGEGGGGRSRSKDGALNLAESLATEDGRSPLLLPSLVEYFPLFFAEMCSLIISSSDFGSKNADFSSYLF